MIERLVRQSMLAAAVALVAACGGDDSTGPDADNVVGVYTLSTINGQQLPVVVEQVGNDRAEITQGSVTLNANGSFSDVTQLRFTVSGQVTSQTETATGNWTRTGNVVALNPNSPPGATAYSMTWDGDDRLTQIFDTFTLVYVK